MALVSPLNPFSVPGESYFWCPWVGSKEVAGSQRSGLAALGCRSHDCPLNCQSGGSIRLVSTCSQVGSVPTSAKEAIGGI